MLKRYPKLEAGEIKKYSESLDKKEQDLIEEYIIYRKARGLNEAESHRYIRRVLGQMRYALEKPFKKMDLKDMREILALIVGSEMTSNYKNNLKATLKNFIKFVFPDWSIKFSNLEDIKFTTGSLNEEKINHKTLLTKEDIEKCIKAEHTNYWRAFLLTQYEAGLRTKEIRFLKWSDIKLNIEDNLTEINIYATKTHKARTIYVKEATHYLKLLKQEQENTDNKGIFVFHKKSNKNEPVAKDIANNWFKKHTKKVLGKDCWNYLLRHSRATELYGLAEQNKISKDTALRFMGHSEDMSETYKHPNPSDIKKMLREQVYNIDDLPIEKKHELEKRIEILEKVLQKLVRLNKKKLNKS
jgi:integrase